MEPRKLARHRWSALVPVVLLGVVACGGASSHQRHERKPMPDGAWAAWELAAGHAFVVDQRCATGPFIIELDMPEAPWGQDIEIAVRSPRDMGLVVDVSADGALLKRSYTDWSSDEAHAYCRPRAAAADQGEDTARVQTQPGREPAGVDAVMSSPGAGAGGGAQLSMPDQPGLQRVSLDLLRQPPPGQSVQVTLLPPAFDSAWEVDNLGHSLGRMRPRIDMTDLGTPLRPVVLGPGLLQSPVHGEPRQGPLTVRIWAESVRDFQDVRFEVLMWRLAPRIPEPEYRRRVIALQRQKGDEARARLGQAHARAEEETARCKQRLDDETCWGPGGYQGALERDRARRAGQEQRAQDFAESREALARLPPQPRAADEPPPPLRAEAQPPRPGPEAVWIAGTWEWTGFAYAWVSGFWHTPEQPAASAARAAAQAGPSADPPPLRAEVQPPAPSPGQVWIHGWWQWSGAAWQWVPGRWEQPPRPAARWRTPRWQVGPGAIRIFLPGEWVIRPR